MLGGDGPRLRMAWSLMLSLPGTPVIFMGDEIGMGENLDIPDRMSVRVPMQWSDTENGGFSTADPKQLVRPLTGGAFGSKRVNVDAQRLDPDSLLNWMERLIRRRKEIPEFGWGTSTLIETGAPALFAHRCEWQGSTVIAVHNLSGQKTKATIELGLGKGEKPRLEDLLEPREHKANRDGTLDIELDGYGYLWLRYSQPRLRK
jgi:maltose alpha-D-glucosyltransferase / alpha-amylase